MTIANKEGGEKDLDKFNIGSMAVGLRLRFLPDTSQEENLSSKEFLKKASFIDLATLTKDKTVEDEEDSNTNSGGATVVDDNQGGSTGGSNGSNGSNDGGGDDNNGGGDNGDE